MNKNSEPILIEAEAQARPASPSLLRRFVHIPSLKELILRLLAAYLTVMAEYMWSHPALKFDDPAYGLSAVSVVVLTLLLFLGFTVIDCALHPYLRIDGWLLLASSLGYAAILAFRASSVYTALVCALLVSFVIAYLMRHELLSLPEGARENRPLPRWFSLSCLCLIFFACALYIGAITCIRYLTYASPNFDFGLFVNMFHNMAETGIPNTTSERDGLLSHFAVHLSPIYYLLLPFYFLFPSALTLQIGQAVIVASGVFPLYAIVRRVGLSRACAVAFGAVYALYPALSGGCMYDIHENCFLTPLLLWTAYFALKHQGLPTVLFALLTCMIKEDAPVYIVFLGLFLLFSLKDKKKLLGVGLIGLGVAYFAFAAAYLAAYGEGIMAWRYKEYSTDGGLLSVIVTVLRNPGIVLHHVFEAEKLPYLLQTLVPLAFLPFMTKKPERLILLGPYILINLMPSYQYQHDIYFQYNFGSFAFLILASVLNFADFEPKSRKTALPCLLCASFILFSGTTYSSKYFYFSRYARTEQMREDMQRAIDLIPEDASLASSTFILAHVAYRSEIYPLSTKHMDRCEYAIVDLDGRNEIKNNPWGSDAAWFERQGWETVIEIENTVAVYRDPDFSPVT